MKIRSRDSASFWLPLYECITMHGPQNVKDVYYVQNYCFLSYTRVGT